MEHQQEPVLEKDLHELRQELEKSIASDTHTSLAANMLLDVPIADGSGGGSVVSGIDREPAVVVQMIGNFQGGDAATPAPAGEQPSSFPGEDQEQQLQRSKYGEGNALKGNKLAKKFGRKVYIGNVIGFDPERQWYKVEYEDGDQEELWWWELEPLLIQYEKRMESMTKKRSRSGGDKKAQAKRMRDPDEEYLELVEELSMFSSSSGTSEDDDWDRDIKKTPRSKRSGKKRKAESLQAERGSVSTESIQAASEEAATESVSRRVVRSKSSSGNENGFSLIGRETRKVFKGRNYIGKVIEFDPEAKFYKVVYEDGDSEELEWKELKATLVSNDGKLLVSNGHVETESKQSSNPSSNRSVDDTEVNEHTPRRGGKKLDEMPLTSSQVKYPGALHPAFERARFLENNTEKLEYFAWGEVVAFDKAKCPDLKAMGTLPTKSPIVHLAASQHHLAVLTAAGQVFVWRNKHGNITERCDAWEHISSLDDKTIVLVDIAGPELERSSAGYSSHQEDQVPDPFFLAAVSYNGNEYVLHGSQPHEPVHTYSLLEEFQYPSLEDLLKLNDTTVNNLGRISQVAVGTVDAFDEPPFIGYIMDTDRVYIRSATKDFMEEVNHITGFSGRPLKIQCGSAYHAIILTDDGRAWTWGRGYFPGTGNATFSVCQPALGSLVNRKVVDIACCGQNFIALTDDGEVHQWTHGPPNSFLGVENSPKSALKVPTEDKLQKVALGVGVVAGISSAGKLHTWKTSLGHPTSAKCATPLSRDEKSKDTFVAALGTRSMLKAFCVAGSSIAVGRKKPRGRPAIGKDP
ncbi:uncharacterized protein LOC9637453 isoform X1 [Selaginella moellendorffii]|uniref:uncharacterized protein LOC9637453 isoform X1 n=1 Tax=Selaginella moellendorffii TaxID=88036 RepID=UPI000D1CD6D7|nr:uncharacterized protein LOC9637453 isoform X1 [Selaginella moellendorffii]|eukprot:XP_024533525.1 uncharacterized protein LOC9637453 isoform X1 [Selaginella moellendorffii]